MTAPIYQVIDNNMACPFQSATESCWEIFRTRKNIGYPDSNPPVCMLIEACVVMDTGCCGLSADFSK